MNNRLPAHLFATDGALYDTRRQEWHKSPPLRPVYKRHFSTIKTTAQFRASLRAGGYTFPGGYPLAFTTADGCRLCFYCAEKGVRLILDSIRRDIRDGWHVDGITNVVESDYPTSCDHCGTFIYLGEDEEVQP